MSYSSKQEAAEKQLELRRRQQEKDGGNTFGSTSKDPCRAVYRETREQMLSRNCIEANFYDHNQCKMFFENYKNCKSFWNAVREFRARQKNKFDLPDENERLIYKKQLKTWLETKKIVDPDTQSS